MIEVSITTEQRVLVSVNPLTESGTPTVVETPVWEIAEGPEFVELEVQLDGLSAFINSTSLSGNAIVRVTADADTSAGVENISEDVVVTVSIPQAVDLGLTAGVPEPKL